MAQAVAQRGRLTDLATELASLEVAIRALPLLEDVPQDAEAGQGGTELPRRKFVDGVEAGDVVEHGVAKRVGAEPQGQGRVVEMANVALRCAGPDDSHFVASAELAAESRPEESAGGADPPQRVEPSGRSSARLRRTAPPAKVRSGARIRR